MSGESELAFFRKKPNLPLEEKLQVESDRRLFGCMGSGSVFGAALAAYALTIQIVIHPDLGGLPTHPRPDRAPGRTTFIVPPEYHAKPVKKPVKHAAKPGQPDRRAAAPKSARPTDKDPGTLGVSLLTSRTGKSGIVAYDLIDKTMKNLDMDKLSEVSVLTRTDASRISGRRGKQSSEFNLSYHTEGEGDGTDDGITLPRLGSTARIHGETRAPKSVGKPIEVDAISSTTVRSTASILAVIRSHSPGLRHLYNTHLKMRPGMAGKITLRFAIAPSGQVVDVGVAGSTTSAADFDDQVVRQVMTWRFDAVKAVGNDIVTVPFNFSE